jgi:hypothetical protein
VLEMRVMICVRFTLQNAMCYWSVVTCHLAACLVAAVSPNVPPCIILGYGNVRRHTFLINYFARIRWSGLNFKGNFFRWIGTK